MIELISFLAVTFIVYLFLSESSLNPFSSSIDKAIAQIVVPEDSVLRRHFLTHLHTENALVAAEIQKRIS